MSQADQFFQYAKEAILPACYAATDTDKAGLLELARTWAQAALQERTSVNLPTGGRAEGQRGDFPRRTQWG
jgi:hypothetical protein